MVVTWRERPGEATGAKAQRRKDTQILSIPLTDGALSNGWALTVVLKEELHGGQT